MILLIQATAITTAHMMHLNCCIPARRIVLLLLLVCYHYSFILRLHAYLLALFVL